MSKSRIVVATASLGLTLAFVPALAGAAPGAPKPQATLVRTHVFHPGPPVISNGRPQPSVANCSSDGPSTGTPAYTGFTSTGVDRDAHFNAATTPPGLAIGIAEVQAAFDVWVTGAPDAPDFTVTTAGPLVTKATANRHTDVLFGRVQGNAIAVTYTWRWSDTEEYESDTVFNRSLAWAVIPTDDIGADGCYETIAKYDFGNIAAHEFGHIYGLGHPAGDRFATMYAYGYTGETLKRTLATSDTAGVQALYP